MATRRLYRSKNGEILGVCKGIAEWRDYPVDTIRLIVVLIAIFTAIAPCLIIYFILGLVLPVNPYDEDTRSYDRGYRDGRRDSRERKGKPSSPCPEICQNQHSAPRRKRGARCAAVCRAKQCAYRALSRIAVTDCPRCPVCPGQ